MQSQEGAEPGMTQAGEQPVETRRNIPQAGPGCGSMWGRGDGQAALGRCGVVENSELGRN